MGLRTYIARRIIYMLILIFFVITLNFFIFALMPGNPLERYAGAMKLQSQEQAQEILERWGLTKSLWERYVIYVQNMLTWNFGRSLIASRMVSDEIGYRLMNTLTLMGSSTILSIFFGVILGVIAAHRRGGKFDSASVIASLTTYSLPTFWMGMVFLLFFNVELGWFPGSGTHPAEWDIHDWPTPLFQGNIAGYQFIIPSPVTISGMLWHLFLPMLTLTLFQYGGYLLLTRATMLEALTEDYITTARAKGLKERTVLFKHALKNASLPIITSAAISFGFMLSGAIITETVFTWPGLGHWIWGSIIALDYPSIQAIFYIIALCVIIANFIADLLYGIIDPRIKYG